MIRNLFDRPALAKVIFQKWKERSKLSLREQQQIDYMQTLIKPCEKKKDWPNSVQENETFSWSLKSDDWERIFKTYLFNKRMFETDV